MAVRERINEDMKAAMKARRSDKAWRDSLVNGSAKRQRSR
jgi:uncharacterized protein YqeY